MVLASLRSKCICAHLLSFATALLPHRASDSETGTLSAGNNPFVKSHIVHPSGLVIFAAVEVGHGRLPAVFSCAFCRSSDSPPANALSVSCTHPSRAAGGRALPRAASTSARVPRAPSATSRPSSKRLRPARLSLAREDSAPPNFLSFSPGCSY